jgi:hypothetical protein
MDIGGPGVRVGGPPFRGPRSNRELVVLASEHGQALLSGTGVPGQADGSLRQLHGTLGDFGARLVPILRRSSAASKALREGPPGAPRSAAEAPARFFLIDAPDFALETLREQLNQSSLVHAAYIKPPSEQPNINDIPPSAPAPPAATPDFSPNQSYLGAAPEGINAPAAWAQRGGAGDGINIIDIEWAWEAAHEDLQSRRGLVGGTPSGDTNHGTAVVGVLGAQQNGFGVTGIAHGASLGWHAVSTISSQAIEDAAAISRPGDILLLEIHRAGPRYNFAPRDDQRGYIAIEWWPDDFDAIRFAVNRGVIVVEAAGNGGEDFDDDLYETPSTTFGGDWRNPYRRTAGDSGAIVVGAGAPPKGTHGSNWGPDRSRLDFSNYGSAVDAQGWGREVTSCGYGDLQGGPDRRRWYTDQFSGTSSASPIVAGALACIQGYLVAAGRRVLTPGEARAMLRETGSPQQSASGRPSTQRIGNRPDLEAMLVWAEERTRVQAQR